MNRLAFAILAVWAFAAPVAIRAADILEEIRANQARREEIRKKLVASLPKAWSVETPSVASDYVAMTATRSEKGDHYLWFVNLTKKDDTLVVAVLRLPPEGQPQHKRKIVAAGLLLADGTAQLEWFEQRQDFFMEKTREFEGHFRRAVK